MSFAETRQREFPHAVPLARYVERSRRLLRPHGFTARNSLALVGACRDELSSGLFHEVQKHWGAPFGLLSLAGIPSYGRTSFSAAADHVPDGDGTPRLVALLTTHIGIDREGAIGQCRRPGQSEPSTACGALAAFLDGLASGQNHTQIDVHDVEMSFLRARLLREVDEGEVPSMEDLARKVRDVIARDVPVLASGILAAPGTQTAVLTGIVIHGSRGGDWVDPGTATLYGPDGATELPLSPTP